MLSENNLWIPFPPMKEKRLYFAMEEHNGKLFAVGGETSFASRKSMEWIDLTSGMSWNKESISFGIMGHCMANYNTTHLIVIGGYYYSPGASTGTVSK